KLYEVLSDAGVRDFKQKMKFYAELRKAVKIRYHEVVDFAQFEQQMQKLMDTFISADEVNQLTKIVNIFDDGFNDEVARLGSDNAKADAILSASTAVIVEKMRSNPAYYEKLSKKIEQIIQDYKDQVLSEVEKLANAQEIQKMLLKSNDKIDSIKYPDIIQDSGFARAVYENAGEYFVNVSNDKVDDINAEFSLKVEAILKKYNQRPDWKNSIDIKNKINGAIQDLLWKIEDEFSVTFNEVEILNLIRSISINQ
ncbi:MAG: DUF3387 domain-containing protein, partial [Methylococcales symbiont of Iophon sp. n. MRB-2018]